MMTTRRGVPVPDEVLARDGFCACGCGERTAVSTVTLTARQQYAGYPQKWRQGHATRVPGAMSRPRKRRDRVQETSGYFRVRAPEHPNADQNGYVLEHRLVMSRAIGRALLPTETVHHISGDRGDNRIENLQLRAGNHGKGVQMQCQTCGGHDVVPVPITE